MHDGALNNLGKPKFPDLKDGNLQISVILKSGDKAAIEFGGEASPTSEYAAVTVAEQSVVLEFPWLLFRDLLTSLPVF